MTLFTVNYNGAYGYLYEFKAETWEVKEDNYITTNQTTVYVDIYMRRNKLSSGSAYNGYGTDWEITIDKDTKTGNTKWDTRNTVDWIWLGQHSKKITHNSDGSKEIYISAYHVGNSATGSSKMGDASGEGKFVLTRIPRASKIVATDADVGSVSSIFIDKADNSFSHTITYSLGNQNGTVVVNPTTNPYPFTVPTSFYSEIPGREGTVTLKCYTYSGDNYVGESTTTFKAKINEQDNRPDVDGVLIDTNEKTVALTGSTENNVILVKNKSTAKIISNATAKNNATIKQVTVNNIKVEGNYIEFLNTTRTSFDIVAIDSRDFTNSKTLQPNSVIDYIPLTLSAEFNRIAATSSIVKLSYSGNYFDNTFGKEENELKVSWAYKFKRETDYTFGGTLTPTINNNKYEGELTLDVEFNYQEEYNLIIYAEDKLTQVNVPQALKKGEPVYDWGVDKNGNNYLFVNGNLYAKGNINEVAGNDSTNATFKSVELKPVNLYENSSGTNGTITLKETSANFSYLEIFYRDKNLVECGYNSVKVYNPNGKAVTLQLVGKSNDDSTIRVNSKIVIISETSITSSNSVVIYIKNHDVYLVDEIYIVKVIGYR